MKGKDYTQTKIIRQVCENTSDINSIKELAILANMSEEKVRGVLARHTKTKSLVQRKIAETKEKVVNEKLEKEKKAMLVILDETIIDGLNVLSEIEKNIKEKKTLILSKKIMEALKKPEIKQLLERNHKQVRLLMEEELKDSSMFEYAYANGIAFMTADRVVAIEGYARGMDIVFLDKKIIQEPMRVYVKDLDTAKTTQGQMKIILKKGVEIRDAIVLIEGEEDILHITQKSKDTIGFQHYKALYLQPRDKKNAANAELICSLELTKDTKWDTIPTKYLKYIAYIKTG